MRNLLSYLRSIFSISISIRSPNSSATSEETPAQGVGTPAQGAGAGDEERPPESNRSDDNSPPRGGTYEGHEDRTAVQTAALAAAAISVQLLVNLPKVVEPKLRFVYEANVAFLCITFFSASYTFLLVFCKEKPAARRREKKLIVLVFLSTVITFVLRISQEVFFAVSWARILLITAVASLLGWIYLSWGGSISGVREGDRV